MDDVSILKRLNVGALYEQYFNAVCRDTVPEIRTKVADGQWQDAWARVMELYDIMSPPMAEVIREGMTTESDQRHHLNCIIKSGFYIYLPPWSSSLGSHTIGALLKRFPITHGPVQFGGFKGNTVTTKNDVLIASNYVMLLNKIGDQWSAVTGSKTQHHGVLAKLNTGDRDLTPGRQNPVKIAGESEVRLLVGSVGALCAAEIMDRSNSPEANKEVCRGILVAENPSFIPVAVDRDAVPLGNNRALRFVQHIFNTSGINITDNVLLDE